MKLPSGPAYLIAAELSYWAGSSLFMADDFATRGEKGMNLSMFPNLAAAQCPWIQIII